MPDEPKTIEQVIAILRSVPISNIYFIVRKDEKDPTRFLQSLGIVDDEDQKMIAKGLEKGECVKRFAQDDDLSRWGHVWIFKRNYYLHPNDIPIRIYIKISFVRLPKVIVVSLHEDMEGQCKLR